MRTRRARERGTLRALALAGALMCPIATVALAGRALPAGADAAPHALYQSDEWGLSAIGAPAAWQYGTGASVRIAVVDTGIDPSQQDLRGKVVAEKAFDSSPCSDPPGTDPAADDNGHGTHVAGIAAAAGSFDVAGAAPAALLVDAKVLDCKGSGQVSDVVSGISWAVHQEHARVVNLSLGDAGTGLVDYSQVAGNALASALQDAWNSGAIPVVAAGNNSNGLLGLGEENYSGIPAVVVAATGPDGTETPYSNSVDQAMWGVAAPGGYDPNGPTKPTCVSSSGGYDPAEILSTYWTSPDPTACYATDEGTSMATPFVSGTLALLLGRGLSPTQAVNVLLSTANHSVVCGADCAGLVNAAAAMRAAATTPTAAGNGGGGPAPAPSSNGASSGGPGANPAAPVPPPTTSGPTSSTSSTSTAVVGAGDQSRAASGTSTSGTRGPGRGAAWWIVLPALLGLSAVIALVLVARRRLLGEQGGSGAGSPD